MRDTNVTYRTALDKAVAVHRFTSQHAAGFLKYAWLWHCQLWNHHQVWHCFFH